MEIGKKERSMKRLMMAGLVALTALSAPAMAMEDDGRTLVKMDEATQQRFLAMMRGFLESVDDMMSALGEGDFKEVARVATEDLGPAHELMSRLRAAHVPQEKIDEIARLVRQRMAKMAEEGGDEQAMHMGMGRIVMQVLGGPPPGMKMGRGQGGGGFGGFGQVMPPEMHQMGMQMHLISGQIADAAKAVGEKPGAEDYRKVNAAISELTGQCRACHAAWKLR